MVSTTEGITKNSPMVVDTLGNLKNPGKLLSKLLALLDVTQKTTTHRMRAAKKRSSSYI